MRSTVIAITLAVMLAGAVRAAGAGEQTSALPVNFVAAGESLHTSGQPSREQLAALKDQGYAMVVNLATPASSGAIPEEGSLVARAGLSYLNIPVDFRNPRYEDFELASAVLKQAGTRRVLLHCQVNKRASVFAFLYRVVHERVPPDRAWDRVGAVWQPEPQWREFVRMVLRRHGIEYDPF